VTTVRDDLLFNLHDIIKLCTSHLCRYKDGRENSTADYDEIKDGNPMHTENLSFEEHQLKTDCELTKSNYFILEEHDKINVCKIHTIACIII
jgi:hypothetical protein